ncbi:MAG: 3-keto-5-aminohexanoate cleavage protein [Deltaproteobacteria bacterium]|nr:3-keto-5-aminohexanoate cleavage protein [Deltaproteobacteria bacterium]
MQDYIWDYRNPYEWMERIQRSSLPPLIVCCAISGGIQGKEANPNLPETPEEQALATEGAYQAGASMVHVHVRDPKAWYNCSGDAEQYRLVNGMIRAKCPDIIINNTTGGGPGMTPEERLCVLDADPEVATLNMGPDVFKMTLKERKDPLPHPREAYRIEGCTPIDYAEVEMFARRMKDKGIKPEMELYQPGHYWTAWDVINQDLIATPYLFQFVMGYQTSSYATPDNLLNFVRELPSGSVYEVAGLGPFQLPMTTMSIILGGHVRVGMEDNIYARRGQLYDSNAQAVEKIVGIARGLNREIATPAQAREMLGLSPTPTSY